jgi:CRISPR-associated protein Csx3
MTPFPAILIGGPPHSGKSVLVYSLTRALRKRSVSHYVLRACPDGEGDWSNESDQQHVQFLRHKGAFTPEFVSQVTNHLQRRHLPLLVDVGGKPKPDQEAMFGHCTHAVLLIGRNPEDPNSYQDALTEWRERMARQDVTIIAELVSDLVGENQLVETRPLLRGTLASLKRGQTAGGPAFTALVDNLTQLLAIDEAEMARQHMRRAPVELSLNLPALAETLGVENGRWQPGHLPLLRDYLPAAKPLALYGRAPVWLYAYLGLLATPADIWLFDVRFGWVQPPQLSRLPATGSSGWHLQLTTENNHTLLTINTKSQYLTIEAVAGTALPDLPTQKGLIISGRLPNWLWTAVARHYATIVPWIAIYYPPLETGIVIHSQHDQYQPGDLAKMQ